MARLPRQPPDPEFARQLNSDLLYLCRSWQEGEFLEDDTLRRDSGILRRLLVDGGAGLLPNYRRQLGRKGPLELEAIDLKRMIEGLDRQAIAWAAAGGATHNGLMVSSVLYYRRAMTDEQMKARYEAGEAKRMMPVARYLDSTCIIFEGASVSRRNVVQFIANRLGGVHFDPTRDRSGAVVEAQFKALDEVMKRASLAEKNAVYFELLGIGQALVASPQVQEFMVSP